jgi:hypothetical protein
MNNEPSNPEIDDDLRPEYNLAELLQGAERGKYSDQYQQFIEQRREEIARDAKESLQMVWDGKLKPQPVEEIIAELCRSLEDDEL